MLGARVATQETKKSEVTHLVCASAAYQGPIGPVG